MAGHEASVAPPGLGAKPTARVVEPGGPGEVVEPREQIEPGEVVEPGGPAGPLPGAGEPVLPFPGPDVVLGSFRLSLFWPAATTVFAIVAVFFSSLIFGPIGIICGLVGVSRGERFSRTALAVAVLGMLAGLLFHALTHNHHSLTTGNYYFD